MKKAIIIGGGFTGFTWAHLLAGRGWESVIIEKESVPGGGIRTLRCNGHPYTHGPRIFSGNAGTFAYINEMVPQREFRLYAKTYVGEDDAFYIYPPHEDDINRMPDAGRIRAELDEVKSPAEGFPSNFEDKWVGGIGETLYRKFMAQYTKKHWHIPSSALLDEHTFNGNHKNSYGRLRSGSHEMIPEEYIVSYPVSLDGWDDYFSRIAAEPGVGVLYNATVAKYDLDKLTVYIGKEKITGDLIVNTASPDELFEYAHGRLPYAGRSMLLLMLPIEKIYPEHTHFLYYAGDEPYLRIVEYKKLTGYVSPNSLLGIEQPCPGRQDYPMLFKAEIERADRYIGALPKGVVSVGRLGTYRYMGLSEIIDQALERIGDY